MTTRQTIANTNQVFDSLSPNSVVPVAVVTDRVWAVSLAVMATLAIVLRIPMVSSVPVNWDAVQYILALDRFDLTSHQPHPPGNPLYVLIGRAFNLVIADPHVALIAVSMIAGAGAVLLAAWLGSLMFDQRLGLIVGLLMLVNPWVSTYSIMALPYTMEAFTVLAMGIAAWKTWRSPSLLSAVSLGMLTAVAGGMRPSVLPFVGLIYLFALVRLNWRSRIATLLVTAAGCLLWLLPLIYYSGGLSTYVSETQALSDAAAARTSLLAGGFSELWMMNLIKLLLSLLLLTLPMVGFVAISYFRAMPRVTRDTLLDARVQLLGCWIIPPLSFFVVVHFGQPGYLLFLAAPMLILLTNRMCSTFWKGPLDRKLIATRVAPVVAICVLLSILAAGPLRENERRWDEIGYFFHSQQLKSPVLVTLPSYRTAGYLQVAPTVLGASANVSESTLGPRYVAIGGQQQFGLSDDYPICERVTFPETTSVVILDEILVERIESSFESGWTPHTLNHDEETLWYRDVEPDEVLVFSGLRENASIAVASRGDARASGTGLLCESNGALAPIADGSP